MPELNPRQKVKAREFLKQRSGDKCFFCEKTGEQYRSEKHRDFDIHHKDRNRENNPEDGSNWELACHKCNCKNDPRGIRKNPYFNKFKNLKNSLNEGVRVWEGDKEWKFSQSNMMSAEMKKSIEAKPLSGEALAEMMNAKGCKGEVIINGVKAVRRKDILDGCAKKANCSQATASRYLDAECSHFGEYEYVGITEEGFFPIYDRANYSGEIYVREKQ